MRDLKGAETLSTRIREDLGSEKLEITVHHELSQTYTQR
jgi:hypothetical protein